MLTRLPHRWITNHEGDEAETETPEDIRAVDALSGLYENSGPMCAPGPIVREEGPAGRYGILFTKELGDGKIVPDAILEPFRRERGLAVESVRHPDPHYHGTLTLFVPADDPRLHAIPARFVEMLDELAKSAVPFPGPVVGEPEGSTVGEIHQYLQLLLDRLLLARAEPGGAVPPSGGAVARAWETVADLRMQDLRETVAGVRPGSGPVKVAGVEEILATDGLSAAAGRAPGPVDAARLKASLEDLLRATAGFVAGHGPGKAWRIAAAMRDQSPPETVAELLGPGREALAARVVETCYLAGEPLYRL